MKNDPTLEHEVSALEAGRAFVVHEDLSLTRVAGEDAERWLQDLLTAGLEGMVVGVSRRALLLSPTGRIRADLSVLARGSGEFVLAQSGAGGPASALLAPYVLSSRVQLAPIPGSTIVSAPAAPDAPGWDADVWRPSMLGGGWDAIVALGGRADDVAKVLEAEGRVRVGPEAVDVWRIRLGIPRFGVDFDEGSHPAEVGLERLIDATKGCFLGQEAVARVRNLGHPPRVLRHLRLEGTPPADPTLFADGGPVGEITSAAMSPQPPAVVLLARVSWAARASALTCDDGRPVRPVG